MMVEAVTYPTPAQSRREEPVRFSLLLAWLCAKPPQTLACGDDRDELVVLQIEQVGIARYDHSGIGGQSGGQARIIIGSAVTAGEMSATTTSSTSSR